MNILKKLSILALGVLVAMTLPTLGEAWDVTTNINSVVYTTDLSFGIVTPNLALTVDSDGSLINSNGMNIGSGTATNETVLVSGTGYLSATENGGNQKNLGFNTGNQIVVTNGGTFIIKSRGGTFYWGSGGQATNVVIVTGAGSGFTNGAGTPGANLWVGSNGGLEVRDGGSFASPSQGLFLAGRDIWGGVGSGSFAFVTDTGSVVRLGSTMSVANRDGGAVNNWLMITNGGTVYSVGGTISAKDGCNNNKATITGVGSLWDVGAAPLNLGNSPGANNNVLNVFNGGVLTNVSTVAMNGVDNVFNLGDGGAVSGASVQSVSLGSAGALLTFNQGLLMASTAGALIAGPGAVSNTGPAYIATDFASSIGNTITGAGSLTKQGSGTLTLSGANTYTGDTTVVEGTLEIAQAYLNDKADVHVARDTHLVLNFADKDEIGGLYYAGVEQPRGLYCAGALDGAISGSGCLKVTKGPSANGFHLIIR